MIEAIREIGDRIIKKDDKDNSRAIEALVESFEYLKGEKVLILNLNIFDRQLEVDFEDVKKETPQKYLWFGDEPGRDPQVYFTTEKLKYLISQTIPNITNKLHKESELNKLLRMALKDSFYDLGLSGKFKYIIDLERLGVVEKGYYKKLVESVKKEEKKESDIYNSILKEIEKRTDEYIAKQFKKKEIGLYTLKINNRLMCNDEEYRNLIKKSKIDSRFGETQRVCSSCNAYGPVTAAPQFAFAQSALGYYITDKVSFSSDLSGEFIKNFILCKECYARLLIGEVFVRNNLSSNIGGMNLYIIPHFLLSTEINLERLKTWAEFIQSSFNSINSIKGLKIFKERIEEFREFEDSKNNFILNLLFYKAGQRNIKVLKLIKDVPPTRIDTLRIATNEISDIGNKVLGSHYQWVIDLQNIYYLIPLRKTKEEKGSRIEYRKVLDLYDSIFSGKSVSYVFLINQFIELAQIYRFKRVRAYYQTANAENWDEEKWNNKLINAMLSANLFFLYLKKLELLQGGEGMDYESLQLTDEIKQYLEEMKYDRPQTALFLLGYLIGEVGNTQAKLTDSRTRPIINKINFEGMNPAKLIRLTNEVFEKLNQYRVFSKKEKTRVSLWFFNAGIFNAYKSIMDQEIKDWHLSDHENVFYVLSGYAYAAYKVWPKESINQDNEEVKENE